MIATMTSTDITMLIAGVVLFVFALCVLAYCVKSNRSITPIIVLLPISIVMIGFPSIKSFNLTDGGLSVETKSASDFARDPNNPDARQNFNVAIDKLYQHQQANRTNQISPAVRSQLTATATELEMRHDLSAQSQQTLARLQLLLGQTNRATTSLHSALRTDTNLVVDSTLRPLILARPAPR